MLLSIAPRSMQLLYERVLRDDYGGAGSQVGAGYELSGKGGRFHAAHAGHGQQTNVQRPFWCKRERPRWGPPRWPVSPGIRR
jgi:hypothetical protein